MINIIKKWMNIDNVDNKKFEIFDNNLVRYKGSRKNVIIPDGVTSIGDEAFLLWKTYGLHYSELSDYKGRDVISITIPDGVTSIGDEAFAYCSNLESINEYSAVAKPSYPVN